MSDWWKEGKYRAGKPYKSISGELLFYNKKDNRMCKSMKNENASIYGKTRTEIQGGQGGALAPPPNFQ